MSWTSHPIFTGWRIAPVTRRSRLVIGGSNLTYVEIFLPQLGYLVELALAALEDETKTPEGGIRFAHYSSQMRTNG